MNTKLATEATLVSAFVAIAILVSKYSQVTDIQPFIWLMIGIATMRSAHTISYNGAGEWLRKPLTILETDPSGAGQNVEPKYATGPLAALGELVSCPICSGTWSALMLTSFYVLFGNISLVLIATLAAAGVSELLHYTKEFLEWRGSEARANSGARWIIKDDQPIHIAEDVLFKDVLKKG